MYARNVTLRIKHGMQAEFTNAFENEILPLLRKQKGFKDVIALCNPSAPEAVSISLWENKSDADEYNTRVYPEVLKALSKSMEGSPRLHTYETVATSFHNVPALV
jgi:heme-degrading monooxygenase HmoA